MHMAADPAQLTCHQHTECHSHRHYSRASQHTMCFLRLARLTMIQQDTCLNIRARPSNISVCHDPTLIGLLPRHAGRTPAPALHAHPACQLALPPARRHNQLVTLLASHLFSLRPQRLYQAYVTNMPSWSGKCKTLALVPHLTCSKMLTS